MTKPYFNIYEELEPHLSASIQEFRDGYDWLGFYAHCTLSWHHEPFLIYLNRDRSNYKYENDRPFYDEEKKTILDTINTFADVFIPDEDSSPLEQVRHAAYLMSKALSEADHDSLEYQYFKNFAENTLATKP